MSKLLIVIPAYNEEANIVKVVNGIVKNYPQYDYVVVNDGSRDKTAAICREHGFRLIDLPVNLGLAGAFQTGLRYAAENGYDCAMQLDADGQHRPEYIAAMLEESGKNAETDMQERALREERVEAERTIQATETALETDGDLLNETERTVIKALIAATRETLQGHSVSAIHEAIEALSRGTENFAAKRMNRSIKKALSGKTVNNVI